MCSYFLLETRQICWNTFLRYVLYSVDFTIILLLVDLKKKTVLKTEDGEKNFIQEATGLAWISPDYLQSLLLPQ